MKKSRLTEGNPMQVILKFTLPLLLGNIFQQLYNMADTIIVGRFVGQNALAAVGSTGTIMFLVLGLATGLTTGFTVMTAQRFGAGDVKGTRRSTSNAIVLSVITSVIMTMISLAFMHPLLHVMRTPAEIYDDAYAYITVICFGTIFNVFYNLFAAMLRAVGNSKMPLIVLVGSAILNVILDLILIIAFHMGTRGAAVATISAQGISSAWAFIYIMKNIPELRPFRDMLRIDRHMARHQLTVGVPMALQFGITASGTVIMQTSVNAFGAIAVAAYTAGGKVQGLLGQGFQSIGQTMAAYAGQNYGSRNFKRLKEGVRAANKANVIYSLVTAVLAVVMMRTFMNLFFGAGSDIDAMMPYAQTYINACAICFIPLGWIFIYRNTMQGCGYGFLPMMGGVMELIARLIMAATAMITMVYPFAAWCDGAAWVAAGVFVLLANRVVFKRVERQFAEEHLS